MNHIKDDMKRLIASTGLVLLLAACGEAADQSLRVGPAPSGSGSPYAGTWKLTSGRGPDGQVPVIRDYPITLTIDRAVIGGTAACNSYGGDVTVRGSSFKIGATSMTEMACAPLVMRSQDAYLRALSQVDSVARDSGGLTLSGRDTELTFALVPPPPTASLIETTW
jgi:heat shock protein HslJ